MGEAPACYFPLVVLSQNLRENSLQGAALCSLGLATLSGLETWGGAEAENHRGRLSVRPRAASRARGRRAAGLRSRWAGLGGRAVTDRGVHGGAAGCGPEARVRSTFPAQLASGLALQELVPECVYAARLRPAGRRRLVVGRQLHLGEPQARLLQRQRGRPRRGARGPETHGSARLPAPQLGPRPREQQLGPRPGHRGRHHHAEAEQHGRSPSAARPGRLSERLCESPGCADSCRTACLWSGHAVAAVGSPCTRELRLREAGIPDQRDPTVGPGQREMALDIVLSSSWRLESAFTKSPRRK